MNDRQSLIRIRKALFSDMLFQFKKAIIMFEKHMIYGGV